jgi:ABC-type transport system substrate-binding protein
MQHRRPRLVLVLWIVSLWLLAIPTLAAAQGQPRPGGTLTVVTPSDVTTFDPHRGLGFSVRVYANMYEPLFRKDEKGMLQGALAES